MLKRASLYGRREVAYREIKDICVFVLLLIIAVRKESGNMRRKGV
jgi:hypothetical protein